MAEPNRVDGGPDTNNRQTDRDPVTNKRQIAGPKVRATIIAVTILALAATLGSAGIGVWKLSSAGDHPIARSAPVKFPAFVYDPAAPKDTPRAYQAAVDYYNDFGKIPCYCGCGAAAGHRSLRDCFITSRNGGAIQYDDHGAG